MSEQVSYTTTSLDGSASASIQKSFNRRGIFFHDAKAWEGARQRSRKLEAALKEELENRRHETSPLTSSQNDEVSRVGAMVNAFESVEAFKEFAEQTRPAELSYMRACLKGLEASASQKAENNELACSALQAQGSIERLATKVQKDLCQIEKRAMTKIAASALSDLGYVVERKGEALKAAMGTTCIWSQTNEYGELSMDLSGFSGTL